MTRAPAAAVASLPANLTDRVRIVLVDAAGRYVLRDFPVELDEVLACQPARRFPAWPGKRNYNGWYWCRSTGAHIRFESLFEQQALTMFDHEAAVVQIATQPFALLWPRSARHHFPDLLVVRGDHTAEVVDVRPRRRIDQRAQEQFERTRQTVMDAGWTYSVYSDAAEPRTSNIRSLAGFRHHRYDSSAQVSAALRRAFASGAELGQGITIVGGDDDAGVIRCAALSMLWSHDLHADLDAECLSDKTWVWS